MPETNAQTKAELVLPTTDLRADLPFFTKTLGMRLDMIYPADNPAVAVISGHGLRLRLDAGATGGAGHLRVLSDDWASIAQGQREMTSPGGTQVSLDELTPPLCCPKPNTPLWCVGWRIKRLG